MGQVSSKETCFTFTFHQIWSTFDPFCNNDISAKRKMNKSINFS